MKNSTKKRTISILLIASLALSSALKSEELNPAILPDEPTLESLQELKEKNGKKRRLTNKNMWNSHVFVYFNSNFLTG